MDVISGLFIFIAFTMTIISIIIFTGNMLYNGDPGIYYSPLRKLTKSELELLQFQYPKEKFKPELYQITDQVLTQKVITFRSGGAFGSYDYYLLGPLKVFICYLGSHQLSQASQQTINGGNLYQLVKGKRKNYLVYVNGYDFFTLTKQNRDWISCWKSAINGTATEKKQIRILGQRQPNKKEKILLKKISETDQISHTNSIGVLLFLPLIVFLAWINYCDIYPAILTVITINILAIFYCFWLHSYIFPSYLDKINIIEGQVSYQPGSRYLNVGQLACHISSPDLVDKLTKLTLNGTIRAVEITYTDYFLEIINIEGIAHINTYWQQKIPGAMYMHYLISGIGCLVLALILLITHSPDFPYRDLWSTAMSCLTIQNKVNAASALLLLFYAITTIGYSYYCISNNKSKTKNPIKV